MKRPTPRPESVEHRILNIRRECVILDRDLADLYGVKPIALRQQVRRNLSRFPADFMFQLTEVEVRELVSQSVIPGRSALGGSLPLAFTEQGVAMLSSVLRSERAVLINIGVMRTFVRLRRVLATNARIVRKLRQHDRRLRKHGDSLAAIFDYLGSHQKATGAASRIGFAAD